MRPGTSGRYTKYLEVIDLRSVIHYYKLVISLLGYSFLQSGFRDEAIFSAQIYMRC